MKMALKIGLPILVVVGVVIGLGVAGVIPIPGLSPAKRSAKQAQAANLYAADTAEEKPAPKPSAPPRPKRVAKEPEPPPLDLDLGAKKLAKLWDEMPLEDLIKVCQRWKDEDLARVLSKMQSEKAASVLAKLGAERAAAISEFIQRQAARAGTS